MNNLLENESKTINVHKLQRRLADLNLSLTSTVLNYSQDGRNLMTTYELQFRHCIISTNLLYHSIL